MNHRIKPILRWPGGKSRLLKKLLPLIPEHDCYGEVFGGGLALFGAKPRSPLEIVNDVNGDLIALYLNVQRHLPEMLRQIDLAVSSRELLFKRLGKLKAQWLLTINDSPFTRQLFDGCKVDAVVTKNGAANNRTHAASTFGELIITP